jgi:hypothetical protein
MAERPESFSIDDWQAVLGPHARARGPSFFKYSDDAKTCKEAKCCSEEIVAEKAIINGILAVNKVAVRSVLSEALKAIWLENKPKWQRPQREAADWQETMTRRLSNAMHHVNVVKSRPQKPAWFLRIVAGSAEVEPDEQAAPEKIYYYDVDTELRSVYRVNADSRCAKPQREYCVEMTPSSVADGSEMAPMIAKFADGSERLMPELTRARYESVQRATNDVWSGEHCLTHNTLHVRKRPDRGLLISLFEQTLQICSVPVDWLETNGWRSEHRSKPASDPERFNAPNTEAAVKRAIDLLMAIAKDYAEDKIGKDMLYKRRDEELNKMGKTKVVLKRPASKASASGTSRKRMSTKTEPLEKPTSAVADDDVEAPGDPDDESEAEADPEAEAEEEGDDPEDGKMEESPPAEAADESEAEQAAKGRKGRKGGKAARVKLGRQGGKAKRPAASEPDTFDKAYRLMNTLALDGLDDDLDQRDDGFIDG